ncbi:MAG: glycosyltransferase family 4 protein [Acidimicrobiia bacterium]|nr:glycosyltransferase family 4 protein [Acidimicrobiia bacterium]
MTTTSPMEVAVVMSRFPKFTETFVVNEILGLQQHGVKVHIYPLLPEQPGPHQSNVAALVERAHYGRPWGGQAVGAFLNTLVKRPRCLGSIVGRLLADTWRSPFMMLKDFYLLPRICAIADELTTTRISHVHAHFLTHGGFAAWALGRLTGLPYSVVAHGSDVHRHRAMMKTKVAEAAFIAAISEFNRAVIGEECGEVGRVEIVHCGVDVSHIVPGSPADRAAEPLVVCVGTLHEVKGQRYLIEAVVELKRRGRKVDVQFVGAGSDGPMLTDLATRLGVDDRVEFVGAVDHHEVIERYRSAHVLVAPSVASRDGRREGIPTVIMEAMAAGTPVVASDLSGIPELVVHEESGLLTPPGDPVAIADAIERLLTEPVLVARLTKNANRTVRDNFDLGRTTARLAELMNADPPDRTADHRLSGEVARHHVR